MEKKVLTVHLAEPWYSMIASGEKTEEYREIKPYWVRRILNMSRAQVGTDTMSLALQYNVIRDRKDILKMCGKALTHVLFVKGYPKGNKPSIEKEIESISIGKPKKVLCPDKWLDTEFFIIKFK